MKIFKLLVLVVMVFGHVLTHSNALDLDKINSSTEKPKISFDVLDEGIEKIEQQLASVTIEFKILKMHLDDIKDAAREQEKADKQHKLDLETKLKETELTLAETQQELVKLQSERLTLDLTVTESCDSTTSVGEDILLH